MKANFHLLIMSLLLQEEKSKRRRESCPIVSHVVKGPVKSLHAIIRRLKDFDLQNEIVIEKTEKLLLTPYIYIYIYI